MGVVGKDQLNISLLEGIRHGKERVGWYKTNGWSPHPTIS